VSKKTYLRHDGVGYPYPAGIFHYQYEMQRTDYYRSDDVVSPGEAFEYDPSYQFIITPEILANRYMQVPYGVFGSPICDLHSKKWLYHTHTSTPDGEGIYWIEGPPNSPWALGLTPPPLDYDIWYTGDDPPDNDFYVHIHQTYLLSKMGDNVWRFSAANGAKIEYEITWVPTTYTLRAAYLIEENAGVYSVKSPDGSSHTLEWNPYLRAYVTAVGTSAVAFVPAPDPEAEPELRFYLQMDWIDTIFSFESHFPCQTIWYPSFMDITKTTIRFEATATRRSFFVRRWRCLDPPRIAARGVEIITEADEYTAPEYLDRNFQETAGDPPIAYDFEKWRFDDGSEQAGRTVSLTPAADIWATAHYTRRTVELTVELDGLDAAVIRGSYNAAGKTGPLHYRITDGSLMRTTWAGAEVTLEAPAYVEVVEEIDEEMVTVLYQFKQWQIDGEEPVANTTLVRVVDANETVTAVYETQT